MMKQCPQCGREWTGPAEHECPHCNYRLPVQAPRRPRPTRAPVPDIGDDAGIRMLLPVGRSGWAIAAGYLALFSVLLAPAPFALAAGLLAVREIKRNPKKHGMGRAVFGIIMGLLGTLALILLLALIVREEMLKA